MNKKKIFDFLYELEDAGKVDYDISYRGGHYGLNACEVVEFLFAKKSDEVKSIIENYLPVNVGAFCNYLGGGLRGSISGGGYDAKLPDYAKKAVDDFVECCIERYEEIENGGGLNDEGDEENVNWDAIGTNKCRLAGILSNY